MRTIYAYFPLFFVCILVTSTYAVPLLDVPLNDPSTAHILRANGVDLIWEDERNAQVVGWPSSIDYLNEQGFAYTVAIPDLESFYANRLANSLDDMGGYPTLSEIEAWATQLALDHSAIVSGPDTLGFTCEGRPLWIMKISDNPNVDEEEGEIFINSAIHAREVITPSTLMYFVDQITDGYASTPRYTELIDNRELYIMLVANPDGYQHNETYAPDGGGMIRKNRRRIYGVEYPDENGCIGVDLNRNWSTGWGLSDSETLTNPLYCTYRGPAPASENETQILMEFINSRKFSIILNLHSCAPDIYYSCDLPKHLENAHRTLADYCNQINVHLVHQSPRLVGMAHEWQAHREDESNVTTPTHAYIVELGKHSDGFWPTPERHVIIQEENVEPLLRFCESADLPTRFLPPLPPEPIIPDTINTTTRLTWHPSNDSYYNPAVTYSIATTDSLSCCAGAETERSTGIRLYNFERTFSSASEGQYSYYSGIGDNAVAFLESTVPFVAEADMAIEFNVRFQIPTDADFACVQLIDSEGNLTSLSGDYTTDMHPDYPSIRYGIEGTEMTWHRAAFPIPESFIGQKVTFRIFYQTNLYNHQMGIFIDSLSPVQTASEIEILAEGLTDTSTILAFPETETPTTRYVLACATDAENQTSNWSRPQKTVVRPTATCSAPTGLPASFSISQPCPNPFNPSVAFSVSLPRTATLSATVHNILGQSVAQQKGKKLPAGWHNIQFNAQHWSSGLYIVRFTFVEKDGTSCSFTRKAVLAK